jgi:hypothetical protein
MRVKAVDFMGTFALVSKAIEAGRAILSIDAEFDKATLKAQINEMMSALLDSKLALTRADEEMAGQRAEIDRLKKEFAFREEQTIVVHGYRYERNPDTGRPQGSAFCDRCERVDGRLIRLPKVTGKDGFGYKCPQCNASYGRHPTSYTFG